MKPLLMVAALLLSVTQPGCTFLIDPDEGGPESIDGAVHPNGPDASTIDAVCDVFTDDGCTEGDVCKGIPGREPGASPECRAPLDTQDLCSPCASDSACGTGLGCSTFCVPYCDGDNPCAVGTCTNGLCEGECS